MKNIKDSHFSLNKENNVMKNKISIIENNNNTLELQKDIALETIERLKKLIIEKDKLIKDMKDKIHH